MTTNNAKQLAAAFAAAGRADITNEKLDGTLTTALNAMFKGRKANAASYKAFFDAQRRAALLAYLTGRLNVPAAKAALIADLKGHKDGGDEKHRTLSQETAYAAFRQRWSRACKAAGVKSPEARGAHGARTGDVKAVVQEEDAPIVEKPTTPSAKDIAPVEHVTLQAAALLAFANKHAKALPGAYKSAIADFVKAVKAAAAE